MFPLLYHAHHSLYQEDIPFWITLASEKPGPILELGCGTGRVLIPLAHSGHHTFGIDHEPGMLKLLQSNLPAELHSKVFIFRADFKEYQLAARFILILMPCNTYSTLPTHDRKAVLMCAYNHLLPGGRFAASMPNPYALKALPARAAREVEEVFLHPLDGEPVTASNSWERRGQVLRVNWAYDHHLPDGRIQRYSAVVEHFIVSLQSFKDELSKVGFKSIQWYGDFDFSPFTQDSPHLIVVASRPDLSKAE